MPYPREERHFSNLHGSILKCKVVQGFLRVATPRELGTRESSVSNEVQSQMPTQLQCARCIVPLSSLLPGLLVVLSASRMVTTALGVLRFPMASSNNRVVITTRSPLSLSGQIEVETSTGRRVNALCYVSETMQMLPTSVPPTFR